MFIELHKKHTYAVFLQNSASEEMLFTGLILVWVYITTHFLQSVLLLPKSLPKCFN